VYPPPRPVVFSGNRRVLFSRTFGIDHAVNNDKPRACKRRGKTPSGKISPLAESRRSARQLDGMRKSLAKIAGRAFLPANFV